MLADPAGPLQPALRRRRGGRAAARAAHARVLLRVPLGRCALTRLAYFFDFDYADGRSPEAYTRGIQSEIVKWRSARYAGEEAGPQRPRLDVFLRESGTIEITDTRECATSREHLLFGLEAEVLLACDAASRASP